MRILPLLPLALMAACSSGPQVEHLRTADPQGRIVVRPMGERGALPGYTVKVTRNSSGVAEVPTVAGAGAFIPDLDPGCYTVRIAGPHLKGKARVDVVPGKSTTLTWWLAAPKDESGLTQRDRILLRVLLFPVRVILWIVEALLSGDDDDDDASTSSRPRSRDCPRESKRQEGSKPKNAVKW